MNEPLRTVDELIDQVLNEHELDRLGEPPEDDPCDCWACRCGCARCEPGPDCPGWFE